MLVHDESLATLTSNGLPQTAGGNKLRAAQLRHVNSFTTASHSAQASQSCALASSLRTGRLRHCVGTRQRDQHQAAHPVLMPSILNKPLGYAYEGDGPTAAAAAARHTAGADSAPVPREGRSSDGTSVVTRSAVVAHGDTHAAAPAGVRLSALLCGRETHTGTRAHVTTKIKIAIDLDTFFKNARVLTKREKQRSENRPLYRIYRRRGAHDTSHNKAVAEPRDRITSVELISLLGVTFLRYIEDVRNKQNQKVRTQSSGRQRAGWN